MYSLHPGLTEDIAYYRTQVSRFINGEIDHPTFRATRVPMGVYEQRSDGTFMVRVRCAGGFISPWQLEQVTQIAAAFGASHVHLTTRQEIQLMGLDLASTVGVIEALMPLGLTSRGGGGNTVRNIMASIESGTSACDVFDVLPYAANLTSWMLARDDSFTLPRKFKISFSSSEADSALAAFNDLGFVAKIYGDKRGFRVYLGGSLANKPMVGLLLFDFVPQEDLLFVAESAKRLFWLHGNRRNKHRARLRHMVYTLGKDRVLELFNEMYTQMKADTSMVYRHHEPVTNSHTVTLEPEYHRGSDYHTWLKRYASPQVQAGLWTVIVPLHQGNVLPGVLARVAHLATHLGNDTIRLSMKQHLHLRNIPLAYLGNVYTVLQDCGLANGLPLLVNSIVSCAGADTCRLGVCLSRGAAQALKEEFLASCLDLDQLDQLRIHISGCPNSCGQQFMSHIGFSGSVGQNHKPYPAYQVMLGGELGSQPRLATIIGQVSARDLPRFTTDLVKIMLDEGYGGMHVGQFFSSGGMLQAKTLLHRYRHIPSFDDDRRYYIDWGAETLFSVAHRGAGECSAGLFDMIEADLGKISSTRQLLQTETDPVKINALLYALVYVSSRMLLITRGAEPREASAVFNDFERLFIDTGLVSQVYRPVLHMARDSDSSRLAEITHLVIDMARCVVSLYEGMDDSMQFGHHLHDTPVLNPLVVPPHHSVARFKDLRGVSCPMNFVRTKVELATLRPGDILEIWLDDGPPINNVPGSVKNEGHTIASIVRHHDYWCVKIKKA